MVARRYLLPGKGEGFIFLVASISLVAVALGVAATIGWFESVFAAPEHIYAILAAAFLITTIGILDDMVDLDWSLKLAGQFLAAGILAWQGVQIVSLPIAGITIGSFGTSFIVTVFLTVLVMNAVNFIDGLDGLVAGVVAIGTIVFFTYSYLLAQQTSPTNYFNLASLLSAIVIGMCLGFALLRDQIIQSISEHIVYCCLTIGHRPNIPPHIAPLIIN